MRSVQIADRSYRLVASRLGAGWTAFAERIETGERFGIECAGESETDALDRLSRWLVWQGEHSAALQALQDAERTYHRSVAGTAFTSGDEESASTELKRVSLKQVDEARARLDEIRARRPG
jgi:hypothetical protein